MTQRGITVTLTHAQTEAVIWAANIGLEDAKHEGMKKPTVEAACRALEDMVRALGLIPYRRAGAVYGRRTARETSHTQH